MMIDDIRPTIESVISELEALPNAVDAMLEPITVPEATASDLNIWRRVVDGVAESLDDALTHDIIPNYAEFPVLGMSFTLLDQLIVIFENMFEALHLHVDDSSRFNSVIPQVRTLVTRYYQDINIDSRSGSPYSPIVSFADDLSEILSNAPFQLELGGIEDLADDEEYRGQGLTEEEIERNTLHYEYLKVRRSTDYTEITESCIICLCSVEDGEGARRLPCLHVFHRACADNWFKNSTSCPMCRFGIVEEREGFPLHLKDNSAV